MGRGGRGRVLVQTLAPQARSIACAAAHDGDGFLAAELERRRALCYPPFSHLIRVTCASVSPEPARAASLGLRERIARAVVPGNRAGGNGQAVLGPAALFRLRGQERQALVVKARERRPAVAAVGEAVEQVSRLRAHSAVNFSVDVDPQ